MNVRKTNLQNIGRGVACELFEEDFKKVLANIADENTEAETVREIRITIKIKPSETREIGATRITSSIKLAPVKAFKGMLFFGTDGKEINAYEQDIEQPGLEGIENVTKFQKGKAQ